MQNVEGDVPRTAGRIAATLIVVLAATAPWPPNAWGEFVPPSSAAAPQKMRCTPGWLGLLVEGRLWSLGREEAVACLVTATALVGGIIVHRGPGSDAATLACLLGATPLLLPLFAPHGGLLDLCLAGGIAAALKQSSLAARVVGVAGLSAAWSAWDRLAGLAFATALSHALALTLAGRATSSRSIVAIWILQPSAALVGLLLLPALTGDLLAALAQLQPASVGDPYLQRFDYGEPTSAYGVAERYGGLALAAGMLVIAWRTAQCPRRTIEALCKVIPFAFLGLMEPRLLPLSVGWMVGVLYWTPADPAPAAFGRRRRRIALLVALACAGALAAWPCHCFRAPGWCRLLQNTGVTKAVAVLRSVKVKGPVLLYPLREASLARRCAAGELDMPFAESTTARDRGAEQELQYQRAIEWLRCGESKTSDAPTDAYTALIWSTSDTVALAVLARDDRWMIVAADGEYVTFLRSSFRTSPAPPERPSSPLAALAKNARASDYYASGRPAAEVLLALRLPLFAFRVAAGANRPPALGRECLRAIVQEERFGAGYANPLWRAALGEATPIDPAVKQAADFLLAGEIAKSAAVLRSSPAGEEAEGRRVERLLALYAVSAVEEPTASDRDRTHAIEQFQRRSDQRPPLVVYHERERAVWGRER